MSTLKLWLIRHGESSVNAGTWHPNPADAILTAQGKQQAQKIATEIIEPPTLIITSPFPRAQESAQYIMQRWPQTPTAIWPIQEIIYLSSTKLAPLSPEQRKERVNAYWEQSDPLYCDGDGAESFASFLERVIQFHEQLCKLRGFIVAVGHGQFFKAYQLGLTYGFQISPEWMKLFRQQETMNPIRNSQLVQLEIPV